MSWSRRYADVPDVYVWGNLFLYYREGDPRACVAPDVFLIRGVGKRKENPRRTYKLWEEDGRYQPLPLKTDGSLGGRRATPVARSGAEASSRGAGVRSNRGKTPSMAPGVSTSLTEEPAAPADSLRCRKPGGVHAS